MLLNVREDIPSVWKTLCANNRMWLFSEKRERSRYRIVVRSELACRLGLRENRHSDRAVDSVL